jgi:2-methylcitrate dehydratase PrpD
MTLIESLAEFSEGINSSVLSASVETALKVAVLDCLGVTIAGALEPVSRAVLRLVNQGPERQDATIIGHLPRASSIEAAALANGTMAHACDYDDSSFTMWGHATAPVLPAILAVAEMRDSSGRDVLVGLAVALEVEKALGLAVQPVHYKLGWHPTGTLGVFGATAGAAKLLSLDKMATEAAFGIAASRAAGVRANVGTMTKPLHVGFAARDGITAAMLASAGVTASTSALEGPNGFFSTYAPGTEDVRWIGQRLGSPFEVVSPGLVYKLYPCCADLHASIDAMLDLKQECLLEPNSVRRVRCGITPLAADNAPYRDPKTPLEAKFSQEYVLAAALVRGHLGLKEFTLDAINDRSIREVRRRVEVYVAPELSGPDSVQFASPAIVDVETSDGQRLRKLVRHMRGHPSNPLAASDLEDKFAACTEGILNSAVVRHVIETVRDLHALRSIRPLMAALGCPSLKSPVE